MREIWATSKPQSLKQIMYDVHGNLVGASNNVGEQDLHNQDMDLSAAGTKMKKVSGE